MGRRSAIQLVMVMAVGFLAACGGADIRHTPVPTTEEFTAKIEALKEENTFPLGWGPLNLRLAAEDDPFTDIVGDRIHEHLRNLTEISQQSRRDGDVLWGRIRGSKYERAGAEYVMEELSRRGLEDVHMQEYRCSAPQWRPLETGVTVVGGSSPGAPGEDYPLASAMTAYRAGTTPPEGIEAEVVYAGYGTEADLMGRDLEGKIVLIASRVFAGVHAHSARVAVGRVADKGAAGVIVALDMPGNGTYAARCDADDFPWITVSNLDGLYLRRVIEASGPRNRPRVRLVVRGELDEIDSQNVMGTLRGTGDEYIIVTAHVDGFWNACVDNGGGVAGLLELARFYSTVPLRQRPYNLLFLVTGDHEVLATTGAHRFAQVYREIIDGTVAVFQLEHMASTAITNEVGIYLETNSANSNGLFVTNMSPLLLELFGEATDRYGIVSHRRTYPNYWGDVVGFADTGVTCAGWISSAFYYHSTLDGLHIVTPQGLERFTRAYAYVIDGTMKASREDIEREASPPSADFYSSEMMATVQSMW